MFAPLPRGLAVRAHTYAHARVYTCAHACVRTPPWPDAHDASVVLCGAVSYGAILDDVRFAVHERYPIENAYEVAAVTREA